MSNRDNKLEETDFEQFVKINDMKTLSDDKANNVEEQKKS